MAVKTLESVSTVYHCSAPLPERGSGAYAHVSSARMPRYKRNSPVVGTMLTVFNRA